MTFLARTAIAVAALILPVSAPAQAQEAFADALTRIVAELVGKGAGDMGGMPAEKQATLVGCMVAAMADVPPQQKQATIDNPDPEDALIDLQDVVTDAVDEAVNDCFQTAFQ